MNWWAVAHDKLAFYALIKGLGLPLPENRALFHAFRQWGGLPALASSVALAAYLREEMKYPAFGQACDRHPE